MSGRGFRVLLLGGYGLLVVAMVAAIGLFVSSIKRHIGSDYTAAASNIVRGQYEASRLRHEAELYLAQPSDLTRRRLLRTLDTIESREGATRDSFELLPLGTDVREEALAEFEHVLERLPRARALARRFQGDPSVRDAFRHAVMAVENSLAFVYSTLHRRIHAASARQERLTEWLTWIVIGLGALLLVIIAALLWAVDRVFAQNATLARLTVTDILTGLPNRRGLLQFADRTLAQHRRNGRPLSLALLDLDDFKHVNDREGHPMGDAVLQHVTREIARATRASDMLARLGGEEFGLLMPETDAEGAHELCERMRRRIEATKLPMTEDVAQVTLSVGLTTATVDADTSFRDLYVEADRALYGAKRRGRNRTEVSQPEPDTGTAATSPA